MSILVSCPFCNAAFTAADVPPAGRTPCPRCGEMVPVKATESEVAPPTSHVAPELRPETGNADRGFIHSSKAMWLSLGLSAVILVGGLAWVYWPREGRPEKADPARPAGTVPPPALAGVVYLPASTNVAFAVQPAAVLGYAERTGGDPKTVLKQLGVPAAVPDTLDRLGLPLADIDHVAGGVTFPDNGLFEKPVVALVLRRPLADEDAFLKRLDATRFTRANQTRYKVGLGGLPLTLAKADDRTYLFAWNEADLDSIAPQPPGGGHLPAGLRDALTTKLSPASVAWAATDAADWAKKPAAKLLGQAAARLAGGRAAAVGLALEPDPLVRAAVRLADEEAAKGAAAALRERLAGPGVNVTRTGDWAEAEVPFDPKGGADVLRKLLPEVGR